MLLDHHQDKKSSKDSTPSSSSSTTAGDDAAHPWSQYIPDAYNPYKKTSQTPSPVQGPTAAPWTQYVPVRHAWTLLSCALELIVPYC